MGIYWTYKDYNMIRAIKAYVLGIIEFRSSYTTSFFDAALQEAYDYGRETAHIFTFRYYEESQ